MSGQDELYGGGFGELRHRGYRRCMGKAIAVKIKELRIALGLNQSGLAERLGVTQASVSRWEKGSLPDADKLAQLAEMAGESVKSFISGSLNLDANRNLLNRLWVRGAVAAGVWAVAYEWPQDEWTPYAGGSHVNVAEGMRYGLRAEGVSMNMVYPSGTILDCVKLEVMPDIKSGQRVIVERVANDGSIEATVKEYHKDELGREWLLPKSYDPHFQSPISANDPGEGIAEIRIIAVVVGSYRPE